MAIYRNPDWEDIPIDYGNDEQPEEEASEPTTKKI